MCYNNLNFENIINNEEIKKITNKASFSFSGVLTKDEIENCINNAIWNASKKFDNNKNTKFTTYLYRGVINECLKYQKSLKNKYVNYQLKENLTTAKNFSIPKIELFEEISMCSDPQIVIDKFFYNFTLGEIANKNGVSKETIRFKLKKNLNFLKQRLS